MIRKIDVFLNTWLNNLRRKPLVIRGARQVGKSTSVRHLAKATNRPLVEINLERHPDLDDTFKSLDMSRIVKAIEGISRTQKIGPESILFLDEIQATPHALAALRYFYEDYPEIPVIAAGSLLEFVLSNHEFSMPVGRIQYLNMGPLTFDEFLMATDEGNLLQNIKEINLSKPIDDFIHKKTLDKLREYAFIGGMPEAITTYIDTKSFIKVSEIHQNILDSYKDDFSKYGLKQDLAMLHRLLDQGVRDVGKKIKYVRLLPEEKTRTTQRLLSLLIQSRLFTQVYHTDSRGIPLGADLDPKVFKLLFVDVGLHNSMLGLPWREWDQEDKMMQINDGQVVEQLIGQELLADTESGFSSKLFYWLRDGKGGNAEVDFVIAKKGKIIPIEVKAGKTGTLKSLKLFVEERKFPLAVRFSTQKISQASFSPPKTKLLSLPLYAVSQLERLIG